MAFSVEARPQVYLAGGFYKDYKATFIHELGEDFRCFDPETSPEVHHIPGYYVGRDLAAIRNSKLVVAYQDNYPYVYGMAAEMGYAVALDIPVIYVCTATRVDSFLSGLARATFTNLHPAVAFIKERYARK